MRARSFSIAVPAEYSWKKPSSVLPSTTTSTTPASTHSAAISETTEANTRISTSGLLNWLAIRLITLVRWLVSSVLAPTRCSRARASAADRPPAVVCNAAIRSVADRLQ